MTTLLRILEGRQSGAEIPLNHGSHLFGRDPENDLVLDDDLVSPRHFSLDISEEGVFTVTPLDGAVVCLDGKPIGPEPQEMKHFQLLRTGDTVMAIGPNDQTWPELDRRDTPEIVTPQPAPRRTKWVGLTAPAAVMVLLTAVFWLGSRQTAPTPAPAVTAPVDLAELLCDLNLNHLRIQRDNTGRVTIVGFIPTAIQERNLEQRLGGSTRLKVVVGERVLASAREIVRAYLPGTQVSLGEQQTLLLTGVCADVGRLQRLIRVLQEDLPATLKVENHIKTPSQLYPPLRGMLAGLDLIKVVGFAIEDGELIVRGTPPKSKLKAWHQAKDAFAEKHGINIIERFTSPTPITHKPVPSDKLNIHSVSIGEVSYITLEDGAKFFEGATLENGSVLTHIAADHIVLRKAGRNTKYKLGG